MSVPLILFLQQFNGATPWLTPKAFSMCSSFRGKHRSIAKYIYFMNPWTQHLSGLWLLYATSRWVGWEMFKGKNLVKKMLLAFQQGGTLSPRLIAEGLPSQLSLYNNTSWKEGEITQQFFTVKAMKCCSLCLVDIFFHSVFGFPIWGAGICLQPADVDSEDHISASARVLK